MTRTRLERWWLAPLILLLLVLAAYANSLHASFQFDDFNVIVNFPRVQSWLACWNDLGHGLRPLLKLSYTMSWTSGWGVEGFRAFNLCVHLVCAWLVYVLALELLRFDGFPSESASRPAALLASLLFAVHPAMTEAVTYISGRSVSLMTFFYLAALLSYARAPSEKSSWMHALSPTLFALAVATKETAITLPLALIWWDFCAGRRMHWRALLLRQRWHWLLLVLLCAALLINSRYQQLLLFSAALHSPLENVFTQLHAMSYLLGQSLMPWSANIDPGLPILKTAFQAWPDLLLWLGLTTLLVWAFRRGPALSFALGWFVLQLLPLYVIFPRVDIANDRQLYLAFWPLAVAMVSVAATIGRRSVLARQALRGTSVVLVVLLVVLTARRNEDYRTEVTLWQSTVRLSPTKARPYNNLGYALEQEHRYDLAQAAYAKALELDPDYWLAQQNLERLREQAD